MVVTEHLAQDVDENTDIWRYMSYSSFMWTIQTGNLHFRRADRFTDPYEGTFPEALLQQMRRGLKQDFENNIDDMMENWKKVSEWQRKITFLNCWHMNPDESAAMWEQYSLAGKGIAIRSTVGNLTDALSQYNPSSGDTPGLASVGYVDFESDLDEIDRRSHRLMNQIVGMEGGGINAIDLFRLKRQEFQHEAELRAYIQYNSLAGFGDELDESKYPFDISEPDTELNVDGTPESSRVYVGIDLDTLIDQILLYPETSTWVADSIEAALENLSVLELGSDDVSISDLYSRRSED